MNYEDIYGVDIKKGMALVGNHAAVYLRLLKSFASNSICSDLIDAVNTGDVEQSRQKAHALKGVSGNLHLDPLFELVKAVEADIKESNAVNPADEKFVSLKDSIARTLESVNMLIKNPGIFSGTK
jgi:HPt (histidine-containing phosphotransfer) domain-containing protein